MAVVTTGGSTAGFVWEIDYDDTTRDVTTFATGPGFCLVTISITPSISRSVAYIPSLGAASVKPTLVAAMAAADFTVVSDGTVQTLASNVNPNQIRHLTLHGVNVSSLPIEMQWSAT